MHSLLDKQDLLSTAICTVKKQNKHVNRVERVS